MQRYYEQESSYIIPPKLLNGNDICEILDVKPSPVVGKALKKLAEAQLEGLVNSREEAVELLKKWSELYKN